MNKNDSWTFQKIKLDESEKQNGRYRRIFAI